MAFEGQPEHDPFVVKPPDAEYLEMEAALRRKRRRTSIVTLVVCALTLAATAMTRFWVIGLVLALPGLIWSIRRLVNSLDGDHT